MFGRKLMGLLICTLVLSIASIAAAEIPDLDLCSATTAAPGPVSVFTTPSANGSPISSALLYNNDVPVDATITLTLVNAFGNGIPGYDRSELWLETIGNIPGSDDAGGNGLRICTNGSIADADTDGAGMTTWSMPIYGGGASDPIAGELTQIIVSGDVLNGYDLPVYFHSADVNGDLVVNLADVSEFAGDYFSGAAIATLFRSNFQWDANMNLADVTYLATGLGASCP